MILSPCFKLLVRKPAGRRSAASGFVLPLALLLVAALAPATARAQGYGRITGIVTDTSGAVLPAAQVTATQTATGLEIKTVSANDGTYVLPTLPPALYNVSATASGFATAIQNGVVLQADAAVTVNLRLKVGTTTDTVTVTANAAQVDTTTGTLSQVVDEKQVNDLPLGGRNAAALTTLVAGVVAAPNGAADQGNTKTFPVVITVSVNGTRANQTNYLLDGGNNVDEYTNVNAPFPFPDALQEFSVQTSNFAAEYGQNAGGVVNIITKSGTSAYHGNVFEYIRNRIFNAKNYFGFTTSTVNGATVYTPYVDPLKRNQFGGTFGGPVGIPGLWKAKQGFFFVGYQGTTIRTSAVSVSSDTLATTQNQAGLFQFTAATPTVAATSCIKDVTTSGSPCFPYTNLSGTTYQSTIPTSKFDKASLALLKYIPVTSTGAPFTFLKPTSQNFNEFVGRYDQALTSKDRMTMRYYLNKFHNVGVLDLTNLLTYADGSDITYQNALVSEAHTFSPHVLNNLILSYQREGSVRGPNAGGINANTLGVNIWQPDFPSIQSMSVSGNFSIGDNPHATFQRSNFTLAEDVHWVKGSHDLSFGFHGELSKVDVVNQNGQPGTFSFNATNTNSAIASFFLGYLAQFTQSSGQFQQNRGKYFGVYAQDSWKATRRLTLNYGLRYEPYIPLHEAGGRMGQFNPTAFAANMHSVVYPNAPAGLLFPGDPGVPTDGIRPVYTTFMPRVGFAVDVFGNGRTSFRGGGGMFYDTRSNGLFNNAWIGSIPFSTSVTLTPFVAGSFTNPYGSSTNPFPAVFPPPKNTPFLLPDAVITFDPSGNYQVPLTYSWNLAIEQQITPSIVSRLAYVAAHTSHVFTSPELNPAYIQGTTVGGSTVPVTSSANPRRVYNYVPSLGASSPQTYASISETNMGGNTSFESLQYTLQQRLTYGLTGTFNYTWSKSLDNVPTGAAVTSAGAGQSYVLPLYMPNYKQLDIGPSDFDHRNNISISYVWQFPKYSEGPVVVRAIINGWQTTGIVSFRSGSPLSVMVGQDISTTGLNRDVPNLIGAPYGTAACTGVPLCQGFLLPASFAKPATGQFGNVKKASFVGPHYVDWDAGLARTFGIKDYAKLQFRAEYLNLMNHTNFSNPGLSLTAASFGRITSANDPRLAQLSLKLSF